MASDPTALSDRRPRFVLAGGSGLIGRRLVADWRAAGAEVVVLTRNASWTQVAGARCVSWDGRSVGAWRHELESATGIVNLTGENLAAGRWTRARKARLRASRVEPTRALVEAIERSLRRPDIFLQASAVGVYGDRGTERLVEGAESGNGFLADLCREWEAASEPIDGLGVRRVVLRTGVALAREGGALAKMLPAFRLGVAGRLGNGEQPLSWIHLDDAAAAARFLVARDDLAGIVHLTAPEPVSNREFTRALAGALRRPAVLPVPAWALRLLFGEMAEVLLAGQRVVPDRLLRAGFEFRFPRLEPALAELLAAAR